MKFANLFPDIATPSSLRVAVSLSTLICLTACVDVGAQSATPGGFDPIRLQGEFAAATDLQLLHTVDSIPEDIRFLFSALDEPEVPADLGMEWSISDSHVPGLPRSQHVFSAVNQTLALVVFVYGGSTVGYRALLAPRHSRQFCLFDLGAFGAENLRLSALQWELNPNKHPASPKTPECVRRFAH